jgi:hypothetical protein
VRVVVYIYSRPDAYLDHARIWTVRVRSGPYGPTIRVRSDPISIRPYEYYSYGLVRAVPYGYLDHMCFFQYKHDIINFS